MNNESVFFWDLSRNQERLYGVSLVVLKTTQMEFYKGLGHVKSGTDVCGPTRFGGNRDRTERRHRRMDQRCEGDGSGLK